MTYKTFISDQRWFSLQLPMNWERYEDDDYAFFDIEKWTGNLRVTPLKINTVLTPAQISEFIEDDLKKHSHQSSRKVKLGNYWGITYKEAVEQEGRELIIYYWLFRNANFVFLCSFSMDKEMDKAETNELELNKVEQIIKSIKIIDNAVEIG